MSVDIESALATPTQTNPTTNKQETTPPVDIESALAPKGDSIGPATPSGLENSPYKDWDVFKGTEHERMMKIAEIPSIMREYGVSYDEAAKNFNKKYRPLFGQRVAQAAGIVSTPFIVGGAVLDPLGTAVGVGAYSLVNKYLHLENLVPNDSSDSLRSAAQLVDQGVALSFTGGAMKGLPENRPNIAQLPQATKDFLKQVPDQANFLKNLVGYKFQSTQTPQAIKLSPNKIKQFQEVLNNGQPSDHIESAYIQVNGKGYEGKTHAEAIQKAKDEGQDVSKVDQEKDGKFKVSNGDIIDRQTAQQEYGLSDSEKNNLFHGTKSEFDKFDTEKSKDGLIHLTTNADEAKTYGGQGSKVLNVVKKEGLKLLNRDDPTQEDALMKGYTKSGGIKQWLQENGYDGFSSFKGRHIAIIDPQNATILKGLHSHELPQQFATGDDFADFAKTMNFTQNHLDLAKSGVTLTGKAEDLLTAANKPYWSKIAPLLTDYEIAEDPNTGEPMVVANSNKPSVLKNAANKVKAFLDKGKEKVELSGDLQGDFQKHIIGGSVGDSLWMKQLLKEVNLDPIDAENLTHYHDDKSTPISPELKDFYENVGKPILNASTEIYQELKGLDYPITDPHASRYVAGKGGFFDRLKSGFKNFTNSAILRRTTDTMKRRVMKALVGDNGERQVVSIKRGRVTAWTEEVGRDLGMLNKVERNELMEKELAPLESQAKKLEDEQDKLLNPPAGMTYKKTWSKSLNSRIDGMHLKLAKLYDKIADVYDKHGARWEDNDLKDKVFVDKNGKTWKVSDATIKEIEANTNLRYHKNFLLNALTQYKDLRKAQRAAKFLDGIKDHPDFKKIASNDSGNIPEGWKTTKLPQFRGYHFDPVIADTLDYFNRRIYGMPDNWRAFTAVNKVLRDSIFYNPLLHIPNIAGFWLVNRGLMKWVMPKEYMTLWKTGSRAMDAVIHQNEDYRAMVESGANLLFHEESGQSLDDLMRKHMGEEIEEKPRIMEEASQDFGYLNPLNYVRALYNFSHKATWSSNDFLTMQAVYEQMEKGKSQEEAIDYVGRFIPNYIIPARIAEPIGKIPGMAEVPRGLSELMSNPNVTMFGAYHYGSLKAYGEMTKALLGLTPEVNRRDAIDKLAAMGTMAFFIAPFINKVLQQALNNKNARFRAAGPFTLVDNATQVWKHQERMSDALQRFVTPAPGIEFTAEAASGRNLFTGKPQPLSDAIINRFGPSNVASRIQEGQLSWADFFSNLVGVKTSDPNKSKLFLMSEDKDIMQDKIDRIKDPQKATQKALEFNKKQIQYLKDIQREEGLHGPIPKSQLEKYIITRSRLGTVIGSETVAQELAKQKRHGRAKLPINPELEARTGL